MKTGNVMMWLDQGPAVLLSEWDVESEALEVSDTVPEKIKFEKGWLIHLIQTGEILSVHKDTLHMSLCSDPLQDLYSSSHNTITFKRRENVRTKKQ